MGGARAKETYFFGIISIELSVTKLCAWSPKLDAQVLDLFPKLPTPPVRDRAGISFSRNQFILAHISIFVNSCAPFGATRGSSQMGASQFLAAIERRFW